MKKNKISKNWIIKKNKDFFFRQSKIKGYRSRSAFKLIEMNKKFKFLKKNSTLLDLGSCPGGWSQVVKNEIIKGKILAVDIIPMKKISNVDFIQGDFQENETYDTTHDITIPTLLPSAQSTTSMCSTNQVLWYLSV